MFAPPDSDLAVRKTVPQANWERWSRRGPLSVPRLTSDHRCGIETPRRDAHTYRQIVADDPATFVKQYGSFVGVMIGSALSLIVSVVAALALWMAVYAWFDPERIEGLVTFSGWATSVMFSFAAIIGASVCLGSSRLIAPGRRRIAGTWISAVLLALPMALLIVDVVLLVSAASSAVASWA